VGVAQHMVQTEAEAIVVGGGTAGSVVAGRLVEGGLRVMILEAGPDYGPQDSGRWPDELLRVSASLPVRHDWGYAGRGAGGQELAFERARVIGGCSAHNGCGLSVGWSGDYDRWATAGCPWWSADDLRSVFLRAEERLRVRRFDRDEVQPFQRAFLDSAVAGGIPQTDDLRDLDGEVGSDRADERRGRHQMERRVREPRPRPSTPRDVTRRIADIVPVVLAASGSPCAFITHPQRVAQSVRPDRARGHA
jgi:choline dehydrogenase-like flavoprotein